MYFLRLGNTCKNFAPRDPAEDREECQPSFGRRMILSNPPPSIFGAAFLRRRKKKEMGGGEMDIPTVEEGKGVKLEPGREALLLFSILGGVQL